MCRQTTPPDAFSGFSRRKGDIGAGLVCLTLLYASILYFSSNLGFFYLPPAEAFCVDSIEVEKCSRPDLFAFQIVSGAAIACCAASGFRSWHLSGRVHRKTPATPEGRLFGYLEEAENLAVINFTFQIWDFLISLTIPEHRTTVFLCHHLAAAVVCWFSLSYQVLHYYGVYFLGLTEVSSVFLVFIDIGRYFPPVTGSPLHVLISICQPAFLLTFAWYRVICWWKVSHTLWGDIRHVLKSGKAEEHRPGKSFCFYVYLFLNLVLGILQIYWFGIILLATKDVLSG